MRKGIVIVGIVLLVLGLIAIALPFATETQSTAINPGAGLVYSPTSLVTSGTLAVSWSGASSNATVSVYKCADSSCSSAAGSSPLQTGTGSSGSFSVSVSPGSYYEIAEAGSATEFSLSLQTTGLAYAEVVGAALLVIGVLLAVVGFRAQARVRPAPAPEAGPEEQVVAPMAESTAPAPAYEPTSDDAERAKYVLSASQMQATPDSVPIVVPARPSASDEPPPTAPGQRPPVRCASCGTWNEPWLDSCRWCKRALTSTGH